MSRPLNDSPYLYGLHDPGGENIMAEQQVPGWILFTEALGCDPGDRSGRFYNPWADQGYGLMVRLNHGYEPKGTIPAPGLYPQFAQRCAHFVASSPGCHIWIIGNEMNHPVERPGGQPILPHMYADCYTQCRTAIRSLPGHRDDQVITGAVAPWNNQTSYPENPDGDWVTYLADILNALGPDGCDGIAIHAYTHGSDPQLICDDISMQPPFDQRQYNFRCYQDFLRGIPPAMRRLPVYLTETNQGDAWLNQDCGWVQQMYGEIERWNRQPDTQKIRAAVLYRWPRGLDRWGIEGKPALIDDMRKALKQRYTWPQTAPDLESIFFPETGQRAAGPFAAFYRRYGAEITGYPITGQYVDGNSGLNTQDWQRLVMEEYPAGKIRLRPAGQQLQDLRRQITELCNQIERLQARLKQLEGKGGAGPAPRPPITDITQQLPRDPSGFVKRSDRDVKYIVINHTAVRPTVNAERVAQTQRGRWPGIVSQFFITGEGQIQQTQPLDEVVARDQEWFYNGINIYVAGNFTETVPGDAQLDALAQLVAWLLGRYSLDESSVRGACEFVSTQSPGLQWLEGQRWKDILLQRTRMAMDGAKTPRPETEALKERVGQLLGQIKEMQRQSHALAARSDGPAGKSAAPDITDVIRQLPQNPGALKNRPVEQIKYLVINHTAVDASAGINRVAAAHQRRWGATMYQYYIAGDGAISQTEPLDQVVDLNQVWIGQGINIALAGNFTVEAPPQAQIEAAARLCAWLMAQYSIPLDNVRGASEFVPTQSPGLQWLQGKMWKNTLAERITALQDEAPPGPADDELSRLRAQVQQLQADLRNAQAALAALAAERDRLAAANADLGRQTEALAQDKAALVQQVQSLTGDKNDLARQLATATRQISDLQAQIKILQGQPHGPQPLSPPDIRDITDQLPKHPSARYDTRTLDRITHIAIHHSAAPANVSPQSIAAYHVGQGWPGIGYHFLVEADGTIYQVNRLETIAYNVANQNGYLVGICVAGLFNDVIPTPLQIEKLGSLVAWLMQRLNIPIERVLGHREFPQNPTACPGDQWLGGKNWKSLLMARVRAAQNGTARCFGHYVLFWAHPDDWAKEDWANAANYIARFHPTTGFSADDARLAEYVTIVGGPGGVSGETEAALRAAGCRVERLNGVDPADTKRMLDELAASGKRFQTFDL